MGLCHEAALHSAGRRSEIALLPRKQKVKNVQLQRSRLFSFPRFGLAMAMAVGLLLPLTMFAPARAQEVPGGFEPIVPHPSVESRVGPGVTWNMQVGAWGESVVRNCFRLRNPGWQVFAGNSTPNGNGFDLVAVRYNREGKLVDHVFGEIRARANLSDSVLEDAGKRLTDAAVQKKLELFRQMQPKVTEDIVRAMSENPGSGSRAIFGVEGSTGTMMHFKQSGTTFNHVDSMNIGREFGKAAARTNNPAIRSMAQQVVSNEKTIMDACRSGARITPLASRISKSFPATVESGSAVKAVAMTAEEVIAESELVAARAAGMARATGRAATVARTTATAESTSVVKVATTAEEVIAESELVAARAAGMARATGRAASVVGQVARAEASGAAALSQAGRTAVTSEAVGGAEAVIIASKGILPAASVGVSEAFVGNALPVVGIGIEVVHRANNVGDIERKFGEGKISHAQRIEAHVGNGAAMVGGLGGAYGGAQLGAAGGAMGGAAIGSVVPVVGTAIGGFVGGIAGGFVGAVGGYFGGSAVATEVSTGVVRGVQGR